MLAKNDSTSIQALMCPEDEILQEHRVRDDYMQEALAKACIYDWTEVVSKLYGSGRVRHTKLMLLYCMQKTLN